MIFSVAFVVLSSGHRPLWAGSRLLQRRGIKQVNKSNKNNFTDPIWSSYWTHTHVDNRDVQDRYLTCSSVHLCLYLCMSFSLEDDGWVLLYSTVHYCHLNYDFRLCWLYEHRFTMLTHDCVCVSAQPTNAFWRWATTALSWSSIPRPLKSMNRYFPFQRCGDNHK